MNVGFVGNTVNLIWDEYEGFATDVETYNVMRIVGTADPTLISPQAADDFNSYTDDISAVTGDTITYFIEVPIPGGSCDAENKASSLNSTRSNRKNKHRGGSGINALYDIYNLSIYPNPSTGSFNLDMDLVGKEDIQLKVFDIAGRLVSAGEFPNQTYDFRTQIDLSDQPAGLYHVHIRTRSALLHRVIVKQ
jgi:hypothetical protein